MPQRRKAECEQAVRLYAHRLLVLMIMCFHLRCQEITSATPPRDTALLIGVTREIEELQVLAQPLPAGSPRQWRALALHQQVYERITTVSLQVDATTAAIDNEIARSIEVRGMLADNRDRNVSRANLLSALLGGGLGGASAGLQLSSRQTNATAGTGIAGGAISAALAVYGIRAQRGGAHQLDSGSNMLARFFSLPETSPDQYPPVVWEFLNEVAPSDPQHLTRRERLVRNWLELKRLDSLTTTAGRIKVEHVTSIPEQHLKLTIDDLEDRIAMLQDVRAKLSYLKRDLAFLLESLAALDQSGDHESGASKVYDGSQ